MRGEGMMSGKSGKPVFLTAGSMRLAREETAVSAERSLMLLLLVAARKRGFDAKPGRAVEQGDGTDRQILLPQ